MKWCTHDMFMVDLERPHDCQAVSEMGCEACDGIVYGFSGTVEGLYLLVSLSRFLCCVVLCCHFKEVGDGRVYTHWRLSYRVTLSPV